MRKTKVQQGSSRKAKTTRKWWSIWQEAWAGWTSHKAGQLGASLAYYSVFSIGPLLLVAVAISALVFDEVEVRGRISEQISSLVGAGAADGIERLLGGAGQGSTGVFASILGTAILLVGALGVVVQLKNALNTVFEVPTSRVAGIWGFIRTYAISLAAVIAVGFLLLVSLLFSTALSLAGSLIEPYISPLLLEVGNLVVSFAIATAIFSAMFKWLPDTNIRWRDILPGSLVTAVLFIIGRFLISFYIAGQGLESTYGAAGSIVAILIWVYYTSQIVLFGAEFVRAYAKDQGSARKPVSRA